ncbi:DMT family transporter [Rubricoccus marinus]|nr:DMT family transporter [Rubricoccus marinus]
MATLHLSTSTRRQIVRARRTAAGIPIGAWYMVMAGLAFSIMNALVKAVSAELPTMEIVFARTVLMGVFTLAMLRREGVSPIGHNHRLLFARGAIGATALSLLYFALGRIPLGDATTIHYTAPVYTALTAAFFLRERIGKWVVLGTLVSLTGVVMIAQPQFLFGGDGLDPLAVGAAVAASILAGSVYTVVRKLRETDHPLVVVLSLAWVGAIGSLPFALFGGWTVPTPEAWMLLLAIGVTTQIGQVGLTKSLHALPAGQASAIGYVQILFAFVLGVVFFDTIPNGWSLAGAGLVLVSVLLLGRRVPPARVASGVRG